MRGLLERARAGTLDVAAVREVDAALCPHAANDGHKIVVRVGGERSAAKGDAISGIVDDGRDTLERRAIADDARQSKDRPRWIIRMQRHAHAGPGGNWNYAFEKVRKVVPEFVLVHGSICVEKLTQLVRGIGRRPTRQVGRAAREID